MIEKETRQVDINCDMGESFGAYSMGMDEAVMPLISSANIACGFHAGDPLVMRRTVELACRCQVAIGAHPGYPDLQGFGRRAMACSNQEIEQYLIYQIGALQAFCQACGVRLRHVKPHGALYNQAMADPQLFRAIGRAVASFDSSLRLVCLAGNGASWMQAIAAEEGLQLLFEAFPDRAYTAQGQLQSRHLPGAVIESPELAAQRAVQMVREKMVTTVDGSALPLAVDTLCIHGDNPQVLALLQTLRTALQQAGIAVAAQ